MSEIQKFFDGHNLFITGGTGFIGKILVEKLLRGLPKIGKIYLLMRPKKGRDIQERFNEYFNIELFEPLKEKNPLAINKVIPISGDVAKPGLSLSDADRQKLIDEVSIVIHAAATTRFNEPLDVALSINVFSVLEIIKLCRELKELKVAVHVSTAFIHSNVERIEEKIYPAPMSCEEAKNAVEIMKRRNLSKTAEKQFTKILLGDFPNTYVFTKSMAEGIIKEKANDLPFCIYRFPIALGTYREPLAGWIDVAQGINQALKWLGMGIIRVMLIPDLEALIYFVPADFVCNALIASTWDVGTKMNGRSDADSSVYNYVYGKENPFSYQTFINLALIHGPHYLPRTVIYFPDLTIVKSKRTYTILNFFFHFLPALIGDFIFKIIGKKPILQKFYNRGMKLLKSTEFFMKKSWSIDNQNIEELWEKLSQDDKELFPFDMTNIDWLDSLTVVWKGVMKYILKDETSPEREKKSVRRYYKWLVLHRTIQAIFVAFIIWFLWKIFGGWSFFS